MQQILSDHDVQGQVSRLMDICQMPPWLEMTMRQRNTPYCLPVLTLADPGRIQRDRQYAESIVERLFDIEIDPGALRGTGWLYLP